MKSIKSTINKFEAFLKNHDSFILTTHAPADADGLGAQMVMACILRNHGKKFRIINSDPIPDLFKFMDPKGVVEQWDEKKHRRLPEKTGMFLLDTEDESNAGSMKEAILRSKEVFVIDHHEPKPGNRFTGIADPSAASTCELVVELAQAVGTDIDCQAAIAAYSGIVYDTGFFAHSKTGSRTFKAAITLIGAGVNPNEVYRRLNENSSLGALQLQKRAFCSMTLHCQGRAASQVLRKNDFTETGTTLDDTEGFVNIPLKSREIVVSILIKESPEGIARCSMRSKGTTDVAKIAWSFGGGGHINASGFKSNLSVDEIHAIVLEKISKILDPS